MNLHGIVSAAIGAVNPLITVSIQTSTGYTTNADGTRVSTYSTSTATGQLQPLTYTDLMKMDGLNITGIRKKLYLNGAWNGVVRVNGVGGDIVTLPDASVWLVVFVFEQWPDWASLCLTLQDGS